jgi:transposase-like protein
MQQPGVEVAHSPLKRWVLEYAPQIEQRIRPHLSLRNDCWRVERIYIELKGEWKYLARAVD